MRYCRCAGKDIVSSRMGHISKQHLYIQTCVKQKGRGILTILRPFSVSRYGLMLLYRGFDARLQCKL